MKRTKEGKVILTDNEFYCLVHAFSNFQDILEKDGDTYYTNENISSLSAESYNICARLYKQYFK